MMCGSMALKTELSRICRAEIKRRSGNEIASHATIAHLREGYFEKIEVSVGGDAPKDFIRVYEHADGTKQRKAEPRHWPAYIAKVGQKYYPNESITEHLITRIGELLDLNMAKSRLMWVRRQLRFCSRYFLRPDESLIHGAEILQGYLADDKFVLEVEEKKMEREVFTFQVVEAAIKHQFPEQAEAILEGFVRLLAFDTIVGNNDRHFFNWGVITQVAGKRTPRFSPIFDSARGLLWNKDEAGLERAEANFETFMDKYVRRCHPLTGWDGCDNLNHFEMMQKICDQRPKLWDALMKMYCPDLPRRVQGLFAEEFNTLYSSRRQKFIISCLEKRMHEFGKAVGLV
jgi:HipA-like C-terminal domain